MELKARILLSLMAGVGIIAAQSGPIASESSVGAAPASTTKLPPYVVYRHFLAWVNQLDKQATASGTTDSYKFAEHFSRANLQHQHLDILRAEAQKLDADLMQHQAKAQVIITKYRAEAKIAVSQGKPFPPAPPEIHDLDRRRIALLVNHYATLRGALGPDVSNQLDGYLKYEFAPHIKLQRMSAPGTPVAH